MSLNNLKDLISDIFCSKFKHDEKCMQIQAPQETMEQYLYTYLSKKYGLKVIPFCTNFYNLDPYPLTSGLCRE